MNNTENQRVRLTKRLLKESLSKLMEQKNISKISISELCTEAGINRTTFYNHYGSQYEVLEEIGYDLINKIMESANADCKNCDWSLGQEVAEFCRYLKANKKEALFLLTNFEADSQVIQEFFKRRFTNQPDYNKFMTHYDDNTKLLLNTFMTNGIYNLIRKWLCEDIQTTPDAIGNLAMKLAKDGWLK